MNKQIMKVAGVIMACTLLIGGSTTVLAKDAKGNKAQNFKVSATQKADTKCRALTQEQKDKMLADLKTKLDADVAAGKITQEKADEIYNNAVNGKFGPRNGMRKELAQEEKDKMLADLKTKLDAEVSAGKITQEKADEIYNNAVNCDFRPMGRMRGECPIDNITE